MSDNERAKAQAQAQLGSIMEIMEALEQLGDGTESVDVDGYTYADECELREHAEQQALSAEVRSDWHTPGTQSDASDEYRLLLCTGGPAVQITGNLDAYGYPEDATLQY